MMLMCTGELHKLMAKIRKFLLITGKRISYDNEEIFFKYITIDSYSMDINDLNNRKYQDLHM